MPKRLLPKSKRNSKEESQSASPISSNIGNPTNHKPLMKRQDTPTLPEAFENLFLPQMHVEEDGRVLWGGKIWRTSKSTNDPRNHATHMSDNQEYNTMRSGRVPGEEAMGKAGGKRMRRAMLAHWISRIHETVTPSQFKQVAPNEQTGTVSAQSASTRSKLRLER